MESVLDSTLASNSVATSEAARLQRVPLTFLRRGDIARIGNIRGASQTRHHLENLGFVEGAEFKIVSQQWGNYIIEIKGSRVAIDKSVAAQIIAA